MICDGTSREYSCDCFAALRSLVSVSKYPVCRFSFPLRVRLRFPVTELICSFSRVLFLVFAPCTTSLSRNSIILLVYRRLSFYLYEPVAKDRALPFISNWNPCCLSVSDCHFLWASWLMFRATFTLWLSSHVVMAYWSV